MRLNEKQTTSTIYKALITGMLNIDDPTLGNSNPTKLVLDYSRIFEACQGIYNFSHICTTMSLSNI
jgi:hypothetical protein